MTLTRHASTVYSLHAAVIIVNGEDNIRLVYWTQRTLLKARLRRYSLRGTAAAAAAAAAAATTAAEEHARVMTDGAADAVTLCS